MECCIATAVRAQNECASYVATAAVMPTTVNINRTLWSMASGLGQSLKQQIYDAVEKVLGK